MSTRRRLSRPHWTITLPDGSRLSARTVKGGPILTAIRQMAADGLCGINLAPKPGQPIHIEPTSRP